MAGGSRTHPVYFAFQKWGTTIDGHWIWMRLISDDVGGSLASMFGHTLVLMLGKVLVQYARLAIGQSGLDPNF